MPIGAELKRTAGEVRDPKVVHFFDCADVGKTLVKYGRDAGYPWRYRPWTPQSMRPEGRTPRSPAAMRAEWIVRRTVEALRGDLMHIHFGTRAGVANSRPHLPFVMHWHGTDIRTNYYDPKTRPNIQWGADHAARIVFATPDLREHAQAARADAIYLPTAIDLAELPAWKPRDKPLVVFSSRWEESKGGAKQLRLVRELKSALGPDVAMEGLDWGDRADEAAALGVRLVPRMAKQQYLRWMSAAHCVIGQSAGIFAVSELQALAMGAPVVMNVDREFYVDHPALAGQDDAALVDQVLRVLEDPLAAAERAAGRQWVTAHHGPQAVVSQLAGIYRSIAQG